MARKRAWRWGLAIGTVAAGIVLALEARVYFRDPVPVGAPSHIPEGDGWIDLLDEAHGPLWRNVGDDKTIFEVADGQLHIFGRSFYPLRYVTYTGETFGDFELYAQVKVSDGANSGIFLRATPGDAVYRGFEVQVLDDFGDGPHKNGSGAIYDVVTPMFNMALPAGHWNSYRITAQGRRVRVEMNGWLVIDADFALMTEPYGKFSIPYAELPLEGALMLQDHGGEVWFRALRVRRLEAVN